MEIPEIKPKEMYELISKGQKVIILDVRTKEEVEEGFINGAVNLPIDELEEKIEKVIPDKSLKVLVYCHTGVRSEASVEFMMKQGYTNVFNMTGGIAQWESDGLPIENF